MIRSFVRNDYRCQDCGIVWESIGDPGVCPDCFSMNYEVVFTEPTQMIIDRASIINHVTQYNKMRSKEIEEEDATPGSEYQKLLSEVTETVETKLPDPNRVVVSYHLTGKSKPKPKVQVTNANCTVKNNNNG